MQNQHEYKVHFNKLDTYIKLDFFVKDFSLIFSAVICHWSTYNNYQVWKIHQIIHAMTYGSFFVNGFDYELLVTEWDVPYFTPRKSNFWGQPE